MKTEEVVEAVKAVQFRDCGNCGDSRDGRELQYMTDVCRVAESAATLPRRGEPSKDLVSQSLSSKLTCERDMAQKALELLLTAQNAFEREREISSQGS